MFIKDEHIWNTQWLGKLSKCCFSIVVAENIIKAHCSRIKLSMCFTGGGWGGGEGVVRDQISDIRPLKIKYQISDPPKNQISDIMRSQKNQIGYLA